MASYVYAIVSLVGVNFWWNMYIRIAWQWGWSCWSCYVSKMQSNYNTVCYHCLTIDTPWLTLEGEISGEILHSVPDNKVHGPNMRPHELCYLGYSTFVFIVKHLPCIKLIKIKWDLLFLIGDRGDWSWLIYSDCFSKRVMHAVCHYKNKLK